MTQFDEFHYQQYSNVKAYSFIVLLSLVAVFHGTPEIAKKTNFNISLLQIGAKLYHRLRTFLLPIGTSVIRKLGQLSFITNWGKRYYKLGQLHFITNWGKCYYKLGQLFLLQIGAVQLLQIRASFFTNQGNYYKLGQLLQIGANFITNQCSYYKLGHSNTKIC